MNALKSIAVKVFTVAIATGLVAGGAFAADLTVAITLPPSVKLGGATLAGGEYKVTESPMGNGSGWFEFRSETGELVGVMAKKSAEPSVGGKTEVILSHEGDTVRVDKLFIAGDSASYEFPESRFK